MVLMITGMNLSSVLRLFQNDRSGIISKIKKEEIMKISSEITKYDLEQVVLYHAIYTNTAFDTCSLLDNQGANDDLKRMINKEYRHIDCILHPCNCNKDVLVCACSSVCNSKRSIFDFWEFQEFQRESVFVRDRQTQQMMPCKSD